MGRRVWEEGCRKEVLEGCVWEGRCGKRCVERGCGKGVWEGWCGKWVWKGLRVVGVERRVWDEGWEGKGRKEGVGRGMWEGCCVKWGVGRRVWEGLTPFRNKELLKKKKNYYLNKKERLKLKKLVNKTEISLQKQETWHLRPNSCLRRQQTTSTLTLSREYYNNKLIRCPFEDGLGYFNLLSWHIN